MGKVADLKLSWLRSPSPDNKIGRVELAITQNGAVTTQEIGKDVQEFAITVKTNTSFSYKVLTYDNDTNQVVTSLSADINIGDLELPLPASGLQIEILAIRDEDDTVSGGGGDDQTL